MTRTAGAPLFAHFGCNTTPLYRQRVTDVVDMATRLICNGMTAFVPE